MTNNMTTWEQRLLDSDDIDMTVPPVVESCERQYTGAIFHVDDQRIRLTKVDGSTTYIRRQVMRHAPCVVMLVHDCTSDQYLLEREYRVGPNTYAFGIPAGLIDNGETPEVAALRELHEETGVRPGSVEEQITDEDLLNSLITSITALEKPRQTSNGTDLPSDTDTNMPIYIDHVAQCYSSEGMTDELANIMVVHLRRWHQGERHFDKDEHVESTWVSWEELNNAGIVSSNATIALKHEALRRLLRPEQQMG